MPILAESTPSRAERDRTDRRMFLRYERQGDSSARAELVARFMPLARTMARRYHRDQEPLEDLVQVAAVGLVKAIDRFDPHREVAFSTFAVPTILGELKRHFRDATWTIHVPRELKETVLRVDRTSQDLAARLDRVPTAAEIASSSGLDEEAVVEARQVREAASVASLQAPAPGGRQDSELELGDHLGVADDGYDRAEDRVVLDRLLRLVSKRDRAVLAMRYQQDMTQAEIGACLGVSQMQVSRLIRQAVGRMQTVAESGHG